MAMSDVLGSGAVAKKIISAISGACGALYEPTAIRRNAKAKADEMITIAKAQSEIETIITMDKIELFNRAQLRVRELEVNRQLNIESVLNIAVTQAGKDESAKGDIDPDWATRFVNYAKDIGNEEMQKVWARVLSQEAKNPGKFSVRALSVLHNISKEEAEIFQRICHLVTKNFILKNSYEEKLEKYGFKYQDLLSLRNAGLLHDSDALNVKFESPEAVKFEFSNKTSLNVKVVQQGTMLHFDVFVLTSVGAELAKLITFEEPIPELKEYLADLKKFLETGGFDVTIETSTA